MLQALWWWLVVQVVAFSATPLCLTLFRPLADRGYGVSKAFGLLTFSYVVWLLVVTQLLENSRFALIVGLCLVLGGSWLAWRNQAASLKTFWQRRRGLLLLEEGIFLATYLGFLVIRSHNPEIANTEKFMDFAFMNAVTRSASFPPLDPWLAPSPSMPHPTINYYHFGYLIQGLLLQLSGVPPAAGYNLALGLLFGLAAVGIFSLGYGLTRDLVAEGRDARRERSAATDAMRLTLVPVAKTAPPPAEPETRTERGPASRLAPRASPVRVPAWSLKAGWPYVVAGLLAVYMLLIAGNLWTALRRFDGSGLWQRGFWDGIGWNATRVLVIKQGDQDLDYTINEFPSFSFLLGDLHPHLLALPFVLVAVALAYSWLMQPPRLYRWAMGLETLSFPLADDQLGPGAGDSSPRDRQRMTQQQRWRRLEPAAELLPGAMVLGSLYFLNSWDFPAYFVLAQAGALAGAWWLWRHDRGTETGRGTETSRGQAQRPSWGRAGGLIILTGLLAVLLFLPFHLSFTPPVIAEGGSPLPLGFVQRRSLLSQFLQFWGAQLLLLWPAVIGAMLALGGWPVAHHALVGSVSHARATAIIGRESAGREAGLLLGLGTLSVVVAERAGAGVLLLCILFALAAGWAAVRALDSHAAAVGGRPLVFACGAICLAALLLAACEVVYIRDFYGGPLQRMNTVFKLYYQAWLLFAAGGSVATFWFVRHLWRRRSDPGARLALAAFSTGGLLLFAGTMLFPYKVTLLRTANFQTPATLDGMDWMRRDHPEDYAAAQWLRAHGASSRTRAPVVLEATGGPYSEFARMATQTGFPTVLGWDQHERLWRGRQSEPELEIRKRHVDGVYSAATLAQAQPLLDTYRVTFVVVGYLEQQKYGPGGGLAKFDEAAAAGSVEVVFRQGQTAVYRMRT